MAFAKCLKTNQALTIIYLNDNQMGSKVLVKISHSLERNKTVGCLYLFNNKFSEDLINVAK
jgi:hypothetical protein